MRAVARSLLVVRCIPVISAFPYTFGE